MATQGRLVLEDGSVFAGTVFGFPGLARGEVVFNTGMVGYPEALTDPSYRGQILALTYPLIGNYGVPRDGHPDSLGPFESGRIQVAGLVVSHASPHYSHWNAAQGLADWLHDHRVPGLAGVDVRALTKRLRERGTMRGRILVGEGDAGPWDPDEDAPVHLVSVKGRTVYPRGTTRVVLIDCGCKHHIIRSLLARDITVIRVPWDHDFWEEDFAGIVISNGPGDPKRCAPTIAHARRAMERDMPVFGICLGHQILALAAGGDTYKLKFGHRGQNQPCLQAGTDRCFITSQNHGYAVDAGSLPPGWLPWFVNANDGTNEGIRHAHRPFLGVQFHPEASPGPADTDFLFDEFVRMLHGR